MRDLQTVAFQSARYIRLNQCYQPLNLLIVDDDRDSKGIQGFSVCKNSALTSQRLRWMTVELANVVIGEG
jgi:hypothetical protein